METGTEIEAERPRKTKRKRSRGRETERQGTRRPAGGGGGRRRETGRRRWQETRPASGPGGQPSPSAGLLTCSQRHRRGPALCPPEAGQPRMGLESRLPGRAPTPSAAGGGNSQSQGSAKEAGSRQALWRRRCREHPQSHLPKVSGQGPGFFLPPSPSLPDRGDSSTCLQGIQTSSRKP